uniref:Exostosin domain-containing protein n=1 Tax=Bursaphelenchus xylophilus TaxID=6326 RepID=A0A1I7SX21_BURXY
MDWRQWTSLFRPRRFSRVFLGIVAILGVVNFVPYLYSSSSQCKYTEEDMIDFCLKPNKWGGFKDRLREQQRIFASIRAEHQELIQKLGEATAQLEELQRRIPLKKDEISRLEFKIEELKLIQRDLKDRRSVKIELPKPPIGLKSTLRSDTASQNLTHDGYSTFWSLENSFDFSRCSIASRFPVFFYPSSSSELKFLSANLMASPYRTTNSSQACIFVKILEDGEDVSKLDYWGDHGRNHLLILHGTAKNLDHFGAAAIVSQFFDQGIFRDFDQELYLRTADIVDFHDLPALLPEKITYLLSYQIGSDKLSNMIKEDLKSLEKSGKSSMDQMFIDFDCTVRKDEGLCGDYDERRAIAQQSTFALIFDDQPSFSRRFYESLKFGSIPVIIKTGRRRCHLPFDGYIDWRMASLSVPEARFLELHFILRSFELEDLLEMKRKGRFYLENYLLNSKVIVNTLLSYLRHRLLIPGLQAKTVADVESSEPVLTYPAPSTRPPYDDEFLGPVEPPYNSPAYNHNFSAITMYGSRLWNELPSQVHSSPEFLTISSPLPSDVEFSEHLSAGMRPIGPGSGSSFSQSLGGNRIREQFTAVIQTYNRDSVLNTTLADLNRLPYLNKVIVVWNNMDRSPDPLLWPKLHCPIVFVKPIQNSLNNRFMPLEHIKTEAVLMLDDDIELKQHEIVFAFKSVWRENRDRLVGFPARYHCRYDDNQVYYNSNHTCQYSLILTGAAFIHKEYLRMYNEMMPEMVKDKVDEWMNCEDLAMNFLIAHLTRKPPMKVTNKWTLRCPTCEDSLFKHENHYNRRHDCIRLFTKIFGYNPLLYTQFRADSVLFKTRVPAEHSKCFRYV